MADNIDTTSTCSSTDSQGSMSDLDPSCIDLSNGDFTIVNNNLLNIMGYNINSLTAGIKLEELGSLARTMNIDLIAISETKLNDNIQESVYTIPGFNVENKHRTRKGGGVCIYIRDDLPYVRATKVESKELEHVSVDITLKGKKFNVSNIFLY